MGSPCGNLKTENKTMNAILNHPIVSGIIVWAFVALVFSVFNRGAVNGDTFAE